jgi:DNA modification methylase
MTNLINRVLFGDALRLLSGMPDCSIDACIADPMHGTARNCRYDMGPDPAQGDPVRHWEYYEPIYHECLRVLRPGGVLAWAQGVKFSEHFPGWFGGHETWRLFRRSRFNERVSPQLWIVQTREQQPVPFPADRDGVIVFDRLARGHPFPRPVEELAFMIEALTKPGQIVLDCFAGTGSTLVAAEQLGRRWIGCDLSRNYCRIAMGRLADLRSRRGRAQGKVPSAKETHQPQVPAGLGRPSTDPPVLTSYQSNNDHLMAQVARLYFRPGDRVADVTYGTGRFWRKVDLTQYDFHPSDLLTVPDHPYDFRYLPYRSADFDVHVFDPPYMRHPPARRYLDSDYHNYETTRGFTHGDIINLYRDGMAEGWRILKPEGLMLVKCKDEIEGGLQRMSHIEIHDIAVHELGMEVEDLFVLTQKMLLVLFRHDNHARKIHSYLWVFRKQSS